LVDEEQAEGSGAVLGAGAGVAPGRLEAGVAEGLGDDDEVGPATHEGGGKGLPQDVGGDLLVEVVVDSL